MADTRQDGWLPTAENINALPEPVRAYIHDLISNCDPSGNVATIAILRDSVEALLKQVEELKKK